MKKSLLLTVALTLVALLAVSLPATAAPNFPGCNNLRAISRYLQLSADQRTQLIALTTQLRTTIQPLHLQIDPLHEQLQTLLGDPSPNACDVGGVVVEIDGLRDQIATAQDAFETAFAAILTPAQLAKWQSLQAVCHAQDTPPGS